MFPHPRRIVRRLRRAPRPVMVLALVLAQCVSAFGYPVVVRAGDTVRRCGCKVRGPSEACCCGPRDCCGGVAEQAIPEPRTPSCPKCKVKTSDKPAIPAVDGRSAAVKWLPAATAGKCRGDGPLGFAAEFPAIPPAIPARPAARPVPTGIIPIANDQPGSFTSIPPDPPPRRG